MLKPPAVSFLKQLLDTPGPSGYESAAAKVWRDEATTAEIAQRNPMIMKTLTVRNRVLIPASAAASGLPPVAKI